MAQARVGRPLDYHGCLAGDGDSQNPATAQKLPNSWVSVWQQHLATALNS